MYGSAPLRIEDARACIPRFQLPTLPVIPLPSPRLEFPTLVNISLSPPLTSSTSLQIEEICLHERDIEIRLDYKVTAELIYTPKIESGSSTNWRLILREGTVNLTTVTHCKLLVDLKDLPPVLVNYVNRTCIPCQVQELTIPFELIIGDPLELSLGAHLGGFKLGLSNEILVLQDLSMASATRQAAWQ